MNSKYFEIAAPCNRIFPKRGQENLVQMNGGIALLRAAARSIAIVRLSSGSSRTTSAKWKWSSCSPRLRRESPSRHKSHRPCVAWREGQWVPHIACLGRPKAGKKYRQGGSRGYVSDPMAGHGRVKKPNVGSWKLDFHQLVGVVELSKDA